MTDRRDWQLPAGVSLGTWEYVISDTIAQDYNSYFSEHGLFELDQRILSECFSAGQLVADLGCGTGRALVPLVRAGVRGLAIDLSVPMLDQVRLQDSGQGEIQCIRANLVELDGIRTDSVDGAICMFSTLGMVRGQANRKTVLEHARRIVRSSGCFVLHVHNLWFNWFDPGGPHWLIHNLIESRFRKDLELGDRYYPYRGVSKMFLHAFTRRELRDLLRTSGFEVEQTHLLGMRPGTLLRHRWFLPQLRAAGWIVVCR